MDVRIVAAILLLFRLAALPFLVITWRAQYRLVRETAARKDEEPVIQWVRRVLLGITSIIILANIIPIIIDVATLLISDVEAARADPKFLGVAYGFNNAIGNFVFSVGWWLVYTRIAMDNMKLRKSK